MIISAKYYQFLRFAMVGIANTAVHAGVVIGLMETLAPPAAVANGCAFIVANLMSYCINSRFTFRVPMSWLAYRRFLLVSLVSLGLTLLITSWVEYMGWHYGLGLVMVIFIVPVLNFMVMRLWAFAPARS
ncbi:GtrA family protein [Pseudomonas promysalinigenes]